MSFLLFEVWAEDDDGHEELIETTASQTEAFALAEQIVMDGAFAATVYQEDDSGDSIEIQRFESEE
jgi:hypothetical protein